MCRMPSESTTRLSSKSMLGGPRRPGADRDDDLVRRDPAVQVGLVVADRERVVVDEATGAVQQLDPVAVELAADDLGLAADDVRRPGEQVLDGDVLLDPVVLAVEVTHVHAGQVEDGLAQGLRRDRARVDADAADHVPAFDDGRALAELGRGDGRLLPSRAGAEDEQVVVGIGHERSVAEPRCRAHDVRVDTIEFAIYRDVVSTDRKEADIMSSPEALPPRYHPLRPRSPPMAARARTPSSGPPRTPPATRPTGARRAAAGAGTVTDAVAA